MDKFYILTTLQMKDKHIARLLVATALMLGSPHCWGQGHTASQGAATNSSINRLMGRASLVKVCEPEEQVGEGKHLKERLLFEVTDRSDLKRLGAALKIKEVRGVRNLACPKKLLRLYESGKQIAVISVFNRDIHSSDWHWDAERSSPATLADWFKEHHSVLSGNTQSTRD